MIGPVFDDAEQPQERDFNPADRARQMADDLRSHAELAAIFEGCRKFDARLRPGLDPEIARRVQRAMATFDRARVENNPILPDPHVADAMSILELPETAGLSTNDYHINRRPGEVMMIRWLAGEEVETFYQRLQAHFDAGLESVREEARSQSWKQDEATTSYLAALDEMKISLAERHLREPIRELGLAVLSTQTADELNIAFLCDHLMGVDAADLVGAPSAPPDEPTEQQLAWFFKLFLLRGAPQGTERACFFTFLQKTEEDLW